MNAEDRFVAELLDDLEEDAAGMPEGPNRDVAEHKLGNARDALKHGAIETAVLQANGALDAINRAGASIPAHVLEAIGQGWGDLLPIIRNLRAATSIGVVRQCEKALAVAVCNRRAPKGVTPTELYKLAACTTGRPYGRNV